ncbi:MAG TPA: sigma-70 family RNA polymerase sigma factor [Pyrinomonadaceae bacterium]|nr:sigma-70 family RNA polymerase sigma factor [Pyrinomonadaceae bacterium]
MRWFRPLAGARRGEGQPVETRMVTAETSDEQIVERALNGDADAFGEIVRRWERRIYALAYGMLGREEEAREATQETFIAAFRNLGNFRGEAKVSSWLHRIAVNQCITRQRRARVRAENSLEAETEAGGERFAAPAGSSPARQAERRERTDAVRRAVHSLPPELREVILMKEFEELTFQQIADALGVPLSTVKSRLYTALRQLRLRLEKYGAEAARA